MQGLAYPMDTLCFAKSGERSHDRKQLLRESDKDGEEALTAHTGADFNLFSRLKVHFCVCRECFFAVIVPLVQLLLRVK